MELPMPLMNMENMSEYRLDRMKGQDTLVLRFTEVMSCEPRVKKCYMLVKQFTTQMYRESFRHLKLPMPLDTVPCDKKHKVRFRNFETGFQLIMPSLQGNYVEEEIELAPPVIEGYEVRYRNGLWYKRKEEFAPKAALTLNDMLVRKDPYSDRWERVTDLQEVPEPELTQEQLIEKVSTELVRNATETKWECSCGAQTPILYAYCWKCDLPRDPAAAARKWIDAYLKEQRERVPDLDPRSAWTEILFDRICHGEYQHAEEEPGPDSDASGDAPSAEEAACAAILNPRSHHPTGYGAAVEDDDDVPF